MKDIKILVVDDDRLITTTLQSGLSQHGLRVFTANNVEAARVCVAREPLDLVVIDAKMPEESGIALADWLQERDAPVPFIFLSAYSDWETVSSAVHHGALTYLVKPVQASQMVPVIHAALERARELRRLRASSGQMESALETNREISIAVGLVMARSGLSREAAFERIRTTARSRRQKLEEFARDLISADRIMSPPA